MSDNAADFIANVTKSRGKEIDSKTAEAIKQALASESTNLGTANAYITSLVIYDRVQVNGPNSGHFDGHAWGISTPGSTVSAGAIFGDNLQDIYNNTKSYWASGTALYFNVIFFDKHHSILGSFQGAALGTFVGTCGGSGGWTS